VIILKNMQQVWRWYASWCQSF